MIDCKKIKMCATDILNTIKKHKKVKKGSEKKLLLIIIKYIDRIIFNYVALASLICLKLGIKTLMFKHMSFISKCVDSLCFKSNSKVMKGGAFNTAAFYGVHEENYKKENEGSDIMNSDLSEYIRPALKSTMQGGAVSTKCKVLNKLLELKLKEVFKHFNVKVSKQTLSVISAKLESNINSIVDVVIKMRDNNINPNVMMRLFQIKK